MFSDEYWQSLSAFIRERRERIGTPGLAVAVVADDRTVYAEGFGVTSTDPEQAVPVTPRTVFRIGSITKPLTGTLLMRLVDAGKLALDEPVVTCLPWFTLSDPAATPHVTLRYLLSHQSGLPWGAQFFGSRDPEGLEAYVREQVPRLLLIAPPGLLFSYSNVGINIAGCIAEVVTGVPFSDLMHEWLFQPLGMERTTLDPLRAMSFPLAQAHDRGEDGAYHVRRREPWSEAVAYRPSAMAYSTVLDMANFAHLHLNRGEFDGQRLLSPESAAEMQTTQVDEYQADGRTVGLPFALTQYKGHRRVGHGGGIASFGSILALFPEIGVAVVLQFNHDAFWPAGEEIVHHVFDAAQEQSPPLHPIPTAPCVTEPEPDSRHLYAGTFLGPRSGLVTLAVAPDGTGMRLSRWGVTGETLLAPARPAVYVGRNPDTGAEEVAGFIALREGPDAGTVQHLMLNSAPCVRVEPNPDFVAAPETWGIYTGAYQGPDVAHPSGRDVLRLRRAEGRLYAHSQNRAREEEAIPWDDGCFVYRGQFLRFPKATVETTTAAAFTFGDEATLYQRTSE